MKKSVSVFSLVAFAVPFLALAQDTKPTEKKREPGHYDTNKFSQMYHEMATPNAYRTASGAPGPAYYQQQADYKMDIELDDKNTRLYGKETVTYYNNAPESLTYLWVQLDQNQKKRGGQSELVQNDVMDPAIGCRRFCQEIYGTFIRWWF